MTREAFVECDRPEFAGYVCMYVCAVIQSVLVLSVNDYKA